MITCDCEKSKPFVTSESVVCKNCGIVIDKIYESEKTIDEVSHFTNPLLNDVHPSINKTLSELSKLVDIQINTRFTIIERVYQLINPSINYIMATKFAFKEQFPNIDINLEKKSIKKIKKSQQILSPCDGNCRFGCANFYINDYLMKKISKIKTLIKKGKKNGKTIDDVLTNVKFSRSTYFRYKDYKFTHLKTKNIITKKSKISYEIHHYINENMDKKIKDLQTEILYTFFVDLNTSTIWRHKEKIKNAKLP